MQQMALILSRTILCDFCLLFSADLRDQSCAILHRSVTAVQSPHRFRNSFCVFISVISALVPIESGHKVFSMSVLGSEYHLPLPTFDVSARE